MRHKDKIIALLKAGTPYSKICQQLGCAKSTVSFHAKNIGLGKPLAEPSSPARLCKKCGKLTPYGRVFCSEECKNKAKKPKIGLSYSEKSEQYKKSRRRSVKNWQQKQTMMAKDYLGGCCSLCGYNKCTSALEFHHIDPSNKEYEIAAKNKSFENMKSELDKCVLLCANCHREAHH